MIELRDEEKKKRIMSAAPRSNRSEILSDYEMTIKAPNVKMIEPKILIRPGIAVTRDAWGEELPEEESEMCHDDLLEVKPASLKLSMAYQKSRQNRKMPPLFRQILQQHDFEKTFDTKLEVKTRVQKKVQEVEELKAQGLSVKEIELENEGGSAILEFLKDHERKINEKAAVTAVIDANEARLQEYREKVYGKPGQFMDSKVLLAQKVPCLERASR